MMINSTGRKWEFTFTTLVTFGGCLLYTSYITIVIGLHVCMLVCWYVCMLICWYEMCIRDRTHITTKHWYQKRQITTGRM